MNFLNIFKKSFYTFISLILGFILGAYLFSGVQPRQFLIFNNCAENCLDEKELLGLLGSVGIQKLSGVMPLVVAETDKSVAIKHPFPESRIHYVVLPKKDIKNIGEVTEGDEIYLKDVFAVISHLARKENLEKYKVITNGPGFQSVAYLHFHLIAR